MTKKEVKKILKDYKDFLNKEHTGMYTKISDYSLNKYIKEQLTLTDVGCSYSKKDLDDAFDKGFRKAVEEWQ